MTAKSKISLLALCLLILSLIPGSGTANAAGGSWQVSRLATNGSQQNGPVVGENLIVWTDFRGPLGIDIWGYNINTGAELLVLSKPGNQIPTALEGESMLYNDDSDLIPWSALTKRKGGSAGRWVGPAGPAYACRTTAPAPFDKLRAASRFSHWPRVSLFKAQPSPKKT